MVVELIKDQKPVNEVELSIIVPCLNEEGNVPLLVSRTLSMLDQLAIEGEIVLVNDGSTDKTGIRIDEQQKLDNRVLGIHHSTNQGIEGSWLSGINSVSGSLVCLIDGDLQNEPEDIADLYRSYISDSNSDVVQGVRCPVPGLSLQRPLHFSRGLNFLLNLCFRMQLRDNKSGFILCSKPVLLSILQHRFRYRYFHCFLSVAAVKKGYIIKEIDTVFHFRHSGDSFLPHVPLVAVLMVLYEIFKYRIEQIAYPAFDKSSLAKKVFK